MRMSDDQQALQSFIGIARLFPLPNVVLFPHLMMPLHIFEPRYRQMTADALAGDRFIAMALLQPGWESEYESRPPIHSVACLGRIQSDQRLPDGRYNIQLRGLTRVSVLQEVENAKLYRSAKVEILQEQLVSTSIDKILRSKLLQSVPRWSQDQGPGAEVFPKVIESNLPLGIVCDVLGFSLPLSVEFKQELLEELNVASRVQLLLDHLENNSPPEALPQPQQPFPPEFSVN
jgi:Lon protease-like protein